MPLALLLPAGPSDRVLVVRHRAVARPRVARWLAGGEEPDPAAGATLVAVDLAGRAPDGGRSRAARRRAPGSAAALLALGAARLAAGDADDVGARSCPST